MKTKQNKTKQNKKTIMIQKSQNETREKIEKQ